MLELDKLIFYHPFCLLALNYIKQPELIISDKLASCSSVAFRLQWLFFFKETLFLEQF